MTHVTYMLAANNRDQLRNPTLGNRVRATFTFYCHVIVCVRAIVLAYNIPGVTKLMLTRDQIVGIYNGSIDNWGHPSFAEHNPASHRHVSPTCQVADTPSRLDTRSYLANESSRRQ